MRYNIEFTHVYKYVLCYLFSYPSHSQSQLFVLFCVLEKLFPLADKKHLFGELLQNPYIYSLFNLFYLWILYTHMKRSKRPMSIKYSFSKNKIKQVNFYQSEFVCPNDL